MNTHRILLSAFSLQAFRLSGFFLAAFSLFCAVPPCAAQEDWGQFRTSIPGSGTTYILAGSGTYYMTPGSWTFNNKIFTNSGTDAEPEAAVYVDAGGITGAAVFTGSNLEILATGTSGNARRGLMLYRGGAAYLTSSTIRQTEANAGTDVTGALYLNGGGRFNGSDLLIEASGGRMSAILLNSSVNNTVILERSLIQNTGSAAAMDMAGSGVLLLTSCTVRTTGAVAPGLITRGAIPRFSFDDTLIHVTGANSPGLWIGSGNISGGIMTLQGDFTNTLVRADDGMGVEVNTNLPGIISRPSIANPQASWAGYYDLTVVSSTISGALGSVRMTSSSSSASSVGVVVEIPTTVRIILTDSALEGDVFVNDGAQFFLIGASSRLEGALRLSGSAPAAAVTLTAGSAITGGIVLSGGAALDLSANNTTITGTLAAADSSSAKVLLTGGSTIDAVALDDSATLELTLDNTSRVLGEFNVSGGATYTLLPADNRALVFPNALTLSAGGNLRVAPATSLTLTSPLAFADATAVVTLANARGDDLVLAAGLAGKGRLVVEGVHADAIGQRELRVVRDDTGAFTASGTDVLTLAAPATSRLFAYHNLENRPDGAYLTGGGFSSAGAAILDTPALAAADFFDAFSPIFSHLALLRENSTTDARPRDADADSGAFWLAGRAATTSADGAAPGLAFRQQTFGFATGADLRWGGGRNAPLFIAGVFADTGFTRRHFDNDASGNATIFGAGLYGLYRHTAGWRATATARAEVTKNTLDTHDTGAALDASYSARSAGLAVEFGWRLPGSSPAGWWAEPSIGAGIASIGGATHDTRSKNPDNRFRVGQDSATAAHARGQVAFGCDFHKKWSVRASFAVSWLDISGGRLSTTTAGAITGADVTGVRFHQLDGLRAEAAAGIVHRLGAASCLWLDCGGAIAAGYKRPVSLTFGWSQGW